MQKKRDIRQRRKSDPISMDADIPLRRPAQEGSMRSLSPERLKFTITASPRDWMTLYLMALNDPEHLGTQILIQMAQPVYQEKLEKLDYTVPRGRHAKSINGVAIEDIIHEIRRHAAAAHTVVAFWIKRPQQEWPDHFKELISELHNDGHIIISPHRKSFNIGDIVSALVETKYEKEMAEFGLIQHIEDDFRKTYLKKNYLEAARGIFARDEHRITIGELFELIP